LNTILSAIDTSRDRWGAAFHCVGVGKLVTLEHVPCRACLTYRSKTL
jgi:hypothetical protein